jgi:hypothetical protein
MIQAILKFDLHPPNTQIIVDLSYQDQETGIKKLMLHDETTHDVANLFVIPFWIQFIYEISHLENQERKVFPPNQHLQISFGGDWAVFGPLMAIARLLNIPYKIQGDDEK